MSKQIFTDIPVIDWRSLDEKILRMIVLEHEGHILVAGHDDSTGKIYILHYSETK